MHILECLIHHNVSEWTIISSSNFAPIPCTSKPQPGIPIATVRWTNIENIASWIWNVVGSSSRCERLLGIWEPSPSKKTYGPDHKQQSSISILLLINPHVNMILHKKLKLGGCTLLNTAHGIAHTCCRCCLSHPHGSYKPQSTIAPEWTGNTWKNHFQQCPSKPCLQWCGNCCVDHNHWCLVRMLGLGSKI